MARVIFFICCLIVMTVVLQRYQSQAQPHYKTIVSIVVHAHHHAQVIPTGL